VIRCKACSSTYRDLLFQELHIGGALHEHFRRERPEEVGCTNLVSVYQAIVYKLLVDVLLQIAHEYREDSTCISNSRAVDTV
jgi:hypothetical protein